MLQRERNHRCERIHKPGNGRAFFRHPDEDLARRPVFVDPYCEVALLTRDREVVGDGPPLIRQAPAHCAQGSERELAICGAGSVCAPSNRAASFSLIAINCFTADMHNLAIALVRRRLVVWL